ncbi:hypothetical protein GCM10009754_19830 [Amycolatopsis minnesotensis]|uniref:Uncharacterized protein n=1 Tax=Amycolatopsis minnesotensis TaxID=337894 RepID=A0ABP5BRH6_9PSEU
MHDYMRDKFQLSGVTRFPEVERLRFSQLPETLKNALMVRPYIRAITILRQSNKGTKFEVFHRLNSGGQPLNAQEVRNVIFRGPLNDLLLELSSEEFLRKQLKIRDSRTSAYRDMQDVEFVLRFLTLRETWENFSGDFKRSMDNFMSRHQYATNEELDQYRASFQLSLAMCASIWGDNAFKRPEKKGWRDQTLAGMYDAQMVAATLLKPEEIQVAVQRRSDIIEMSRRLFEDPDFESAVRVATNTPAKLVLRVSDMLRVLKLDSK